VVLREAEVFDIAADLVCGNHVDLIGAVRLDRCHQPVDAVVLEVEIACLGVEGEPRGRAQTRGDLDHIDTDNRGAVVGECDAMDGVARQVRRQADSAGQGSRVGCRREVDLRTQREVELVGV
jgi:hypothetical protein